MKEMNARALAAILRQPLVEEENREAAIKAVNDYLETATKLIRDFASTNPYLSDIDMIAVPVEFVSREKIKCGDVVTTKRVYSTRKKELRDVYTDAGFKSVQNIAELEYDFLYDRWAEYSDSRMFLKYFIVELKERGFDVWVNSCDWGAYENEFGKEPDILPQISVSFINGDLGELEETQNSARALAEILREPLKIGAAKQAVEQYIHETELKFTKLIEENPNFPHEASGAAIPISSALFETGKIVTEELLPMDSSVYLNEHCERLTDQDWIYKMPFTDSKIFLDAVIKELKHKHFDIHVSRTDDRIRILPIVYIEDSPQEEESEES
jgi:hypothetical protein